MSVHRSLTQPATIIATCALLVAIGGTGVAISMLPKNSVGTAQIKKNAVNSAKVKDGSLLAADFKAGQLPRGETGATGATGARGPSDAFVAYRGGTPMSLTGGFQAVITSPQLPAGNYVVSARANLVNTGGSVVSGIVCSIGQDAVQSLTMNTGEQVPLAMQSGFTLATPGTVDLHCLKGGAGTIQVFQGSIIATSVATLTGQPAG